MQIQGNCEGSSWEKRNLPSALQAPRFKLTKCFTIITVLSARELKAESQTSHKVQCQTSDWQLL